MEVLSQMEMKVLQLSLVRKVINVGRFNSFEEFVRVDRYRQDLEIEVAVIERNQAGVVLCG
ncbi:MAG: hypothetical protein SCALA701_25500 [Candidatus Scalindua sp.]|nr:hypothetical protein [Planctomycetota bacterium]RZV82956.1 MAG: hypothetical protein EX341_09195 [Candidatus Scalindua sp. SCAELEC01]GJQ59749.1 MAG: hypothetical protein SCALA701_25500 [Candidatus Scalindua sp.]